MTAPPAPRHDRLERLTSEEFDLLVIGAGALGASTAWAAARAGARVAVVDAGDVAGATSSASSKLIHGGLRYLRLGDVRLVREAHRERRWNGDVVAPHLVRPLRFVLPVAPGSPYRASELRLGAFAYAALSGFRDGRTGKVRVAEAIAGAPGLRHDDCRTTFVVYHDHRTNDARLVLAALRTAETFGACVATRVRVEALRIAGDRICGADVRDLRGGASFLISARAVVNAAGPWIDRLRALESPAAGTSVRLSKGTHITLETGENWSAAVTAPLPHGRVSFAIPWYGMLLLGTTDEPYDGDPAAVTATDADVDQILAEAASALTPDTLRSELVRGAFAGLRVLPVGPGGTSSARRETVVSVGRHGLVSVAGGKLTTWRRVGCDVAERALAGLGLRPLDRSPAPVIGAGDPTELASRLARAWPQLPAETCRHLVGLHGSLAGEVLAPAAQDPSLLEPIVSGAPDILAQARYAVDQEHALTADDVIRRRTTVGLRGLDEAAKARLAGLFDSGAKATAH